MRRTGSPRARKPAPGRQGPWSSPKAAFEEVHRVLWAVYSADERLQLEVERRYASTPWPVGCGPPPSRSKWLELAFAGFIGEHTRYEFAPHDPRADALRRELDGLAASDWRARRAALELQKWWPSSPRTRARTGIADAARCLVRLGPEVRVLQHVTPRLAALWAIAGGLEAPCDADEFVRREAKWTAAMKREKHRARSGSGKRT